MKFVNETDAIAELFRGELSADWMHSSLVARVRHRLMPDGELQPVDEDNALTDIRRDREIDEYGVLEPDIPMPRVATDVIVLADACVPHGEPVVATKVRVVAGPYDEELLVIGDRFWERGLGGDLAASRPLPFITMPLTWTNAFGGNAKTEYGEMGWPANPFGKGFYLDAASAAAGPLPNIEDPANPITTWEDRPDPVGIGPYPNEWHLRQRQVMEIREQEGTLIAHPEQGMFDRAHPRLSGRPVAAGESVEITNTTFASRVSFSIPPCPVEMELHHGNKSWVRTLELE
jgi:hypothetical protein